MALSPEKTILRLGYGGLIPFVLLALLMWFVRADLRPLVALALAGYGAVIVSFLGGIHWGVGFQMGEAAPQLHFVWGVAPALLAWLALLMPGRAGLPLLALVLVACYAVDRATYPVAGLGRWLPLRLQLTAVAALSCLVGAAGTWIMRA